MRTAILWFRRDLRLSDHPALHAALRSGHRIVSLYVHAPHELAPWSPGAASHWWLHHSLAALDADLRALGSRLLIRAGDSLEQIEQVAQAVDADSVYWHRQYEPAAIDRDRKVKQSLRMHGLHAESYNGSLLIEPWQVETGQGDPYKVFTPFWNKVRARLGDAQPLPRPQALPETPQASSLALHELNLLPRIGWDSQFYQHWQPGEAGAQARLAEFLVQAIDAYQERRDRPDCDGSSRLSPHLHFGEISPRQVLAAIQARSLEPDGGQEGMNSFVRELGWREFSHHLLYHFPHTTQAPLNPRFVDFPWAEDASARAAWQHGRTGIPVVDAGMRQLWQTGWMHNRVRMLVASLLTKNLGQHWLHGARWFWDTLVDADLANNTQGWQWTAGSGADAAPYFRIFNPISQGQRFDPDGDYVARWLPELAGVPAKWRQQPWTAPPQVLDHAGLRADSIYRRSMLDLSATRQHALAAYETIRAPRR